VKDKYNHDQYQSHRKSPHLLVYIPFLLGDFLLELFASHFLLVKNTFLPTFLLLHFSSLQTFTISAGDE